MLGVTLSAQYHQFHPTWKLFAVFFRLQLYADQLKAFFFFLLLFSFFSTIFEKSNFCQKIQFLQNPNNFTSFSSKFFFFFFLVKSKLSTAKKSKTTTFSRVFHPSKIDNFLGKSKLIFWTKNEDFEQCVFMRFFCVFQTIFTYFVRSEQRKLQY